MNYVSLKSYLTKTIVSIKNYGVSETARKIIQKLRFGSTMALVSHNYPNWIKRFDTLRSSDLEEMRAKAAGFIHRPMLSVVIPVYNTNHSYLRETLDSILAQSYSNFEVCIADDASPDEEVRTILQEYVKKDGRIKLLFRKTNGGICAASNSALSLVTGEYIVLVDHDDLLPAHTLFTVCHYINTHHNQVDLLYSDEDKLDEQGRRHAPYFKGGWNRRLIFQQNFVAHLGVYRTSILKEIGGFREGFEGSQDYDLVLRFLKKTTDGRIVHIPHILYHWRKYAEYGSFSTTNQHKSDLAAQKALEDYFDGEKEILPREGLCGCWRVLKNEIREKPKISIIIPTKDKVGILKHCIDGILEKTVYPDLELIVVDNGSTEKMTLDYLKDLQTKPNVQVIHDDGAFNYSRLNNEAVKQAQGDYLLFLNNDIAVIEKDWLANMVATAMEPGVGAVGAKLLYANNHVQHAGVVTGIYEVAGHLYRHTHDTDGGYFGLLFLEREMSAVTGACMMVPKHIFLEVDGFDQENLAISFNDVDLCLKIRAAGYRVVYTPYVKLYHLESLSRGMDITKEQKVQNYSERRFMLKKYEKALLRDPYYSPILSLTNEDGTMADCPRVGKPWRNWVEFVCPFHRGDVLLGLQVAYTAAKHGIHVRMHVSKDLVEWLRDFEYGTAIAIEPIDIGIPTAEQTGQFLKEAMDKVALRKDSSCRIICSHPVRNLEDMGIGLIENMLRQFELSIDTKLVNLKLKPISTERKNELVSSLIYPLREVVLLHPSAGWKLKSMSPDIIFKIVSMCHEAGYKVIQIGGENDPVTDGLDGTMLENLSLSEWNYLFQSVHAVIGVDSWTAHFASIVNANQGIVYGSTDHRDVGSKRHFADSTGKCVVISSLCDQVPCNSLICKFGGSYCMGMNVEETLKELLS